MLLSRIIAYSLPGSGRSLRISRCHAAGSLISANRFLVAASSINRAILVPVGSLSFFSCCCGSVFSLRNSTKCLISKMLQLAEAKCPSGGHSQPQPLLRDGPSSVGATPSSRFRSLCGLAANDFHRGLGAFGFDDRDLGIAPTG